MHQCSSLYQNLFAVLCDIPLEPALADMLPVALTSALHPSASLPLHSWFTLCIHVAHHPCLHVQEESAQGLCSAYTPAMGLCQKAAVLRLHQLATCPAIWTHVTSARRMSALGKAHALGRPVSVTPPTAVHTVRCNAASLLAACLCAVRLRCMHPVASLQQLNAALRASLLALL